jgi:hypothetical protein
MSLYLEMLSGRMLSEEELLESIRHVIGKDKEYKTVEELQRSSDYQNIKPLALDQAKLSTAKNLEELSVQIKSKTKELKDLADAHSCKVSTTMVRH